MLFLLAYTVCICSRLVLAVELTTTYGKVNGFQISTKIADPTRSTANVFLGIPFAQPPVGELRFERPVEPKPWANVLNVTAFKPTCMPLSRVVMFSEEKNYSEDCLYLNVISPNWQSPDPSKHFAIMVFIHGGGFEVGSAAEFSYEFFAEHYLSRDVIVITVQYRLAQFGFMTLDDDVFSGNYGLWDLIAALKFIKQNAVRFGGDPDRITIFGHSAGGAAVGHLTLSPHAEGLFNNALQMSGSPLAEWACSRRTESSRKLADALGCKIADAMAVKACLKEKTTAEILNAVDEIGNYRKNSVNFLIFVPHVDGHLHPRKLSDAYFMRSKTPTLIGVADAEGVAFTIGGALRQLTDLYVEPEQYANFDEMRFIEFVDKLITNKETVGSTAAVKELRQRIIDFYIYNAHKHMPPRLFGEVSGERDNAFYIRQYTKIISDVMFVVPSLIDAQTKAKNGWPVYLYRFGYINIDTIHDKHKPMFITNTHSGEYPYLYDIHFETKKVPFNTDDFAFQRNFLATIIQFAKTGNPTPIGGEAWPRLDGANIDTLPHVELAPELAVHNNISFFMETLAFWHGIRTDFDFPDVHLFNAYGRDFKEEL